MTRAGIRRISRAPPSASLSVDRRANSSVSHTGEGSTRGISDGKYVLLLDDPHQATTQPAAVHRVHFQRKDNATGQVADHEPSGLTVSVFERSPSPSLRDWLDSSGLLPPGSEISLVRLTGVKEGLRVTLRQQPAPNEFVYFATDQYVYGLVAYDAKGGKMLRSFRLLPDSSRAHMRH